MGWRIKVINVYQQSKAPEKSMIFRGCCKVLWLYSSAFPKSGDFSGVGSQVHRTCSQLEHIQAAVLVGAVQLAAVTGHGDAIAVLVLVVDGAAARVAVHRNVAPHLAVGAVGRYVKRLLAAIGRRWLLGCRLAFLYRLRLSLLGGSDKHTVVGDNAVEKRFFGGGVDNCFGVGRGTAGGGCNGFSAAAGNERHSDKERHNEEEKRFLVSHSLFIVKMQKYKKI